MSAFFLKKNIWEKLAQKKSRPKLIERDLFLLTIGKR
jgi:hypothetical protein